MTDLKAENARLRAVVEAARAIDDMFESADRGEWLEARDTLHDALKGLER